MPVFIGAILRMKKTRPHPNSLLPATWQDQVSWMSHAGYVQVTEAFNAARMRQGYYRTINQNNPVAPDTVPDTKSEQVTHPTPAPRGRAWNKRVPPALLPAPTIRGYPCGNLEARPWQHTPQWAIGQHSQHSLAGRQYPKILS